MFNDLQRATTSIDNVVKFLEVFARVDVPAGAQGALSDVDPAFSGRPAVPQSQARELAALIPDSRLVMLNSRSHILTEHEPACAVFLAEIDSFLASA